MDTAICTVTTDSDTTCIIYHHELIAIVIATIIIFDQEFIIKLNMSCIQNSDSHDIFE